MESQARTRRPGQTNPGVHSLCTEDLTCCRATKFLSSYVNPARFALVSAVCLSRCRDLWLKRASHQHRFVMKLSYVALMRWRPGDQEPVLLGVGAELSDYSFFQRGSVKEFMTFTAKTVTRKTQVGARQTVKAQAYMCHVVVRDSHLAAAVFCDEEYPSRAAMSVAMQTINEFETSGTTAWKTTEVDVTDAQSLCEQALVKYKVRFRAKISSQSARRWRILYCCSSGRQCQVECCINARVCRIHRKRTSSRVFSKSWTKPRRSCIRR
jgi:hypothetical protein